MWINLTKSTLNNWENKNVIFKKTNTKNVVLKQRCDVFVNDNCFIIPEWDVMRLTNITIKSLRKSGSAPCRVSLCQTHVTFKVHDLIWEKMTNGDFGFVTWSNLQKTETCGGGGGWKYRLGRGKASWRGMLKGLKLLYCVPSSTRNTVSHRC